MTHWLKVCCSGLVFSALISGCHIENHDGEVTSGPGDTCGDFCLHLYDCGSLSGDHIGSCVDQCTGQMRADHDRTVDGCDCVMDDECRPLGDYHCSGAPIPTSPGDGSSTNSGGSSAASGGGSASNMGGTSSSSGGSSTNNGGASNSGGSSSSSGGTSSSGGGTTLGCQGGYECAADEDCVDGACRQRCSASCECPTDLSCVDHYCRSSEPPPKCTVDCECASGQHCSNGACR